MICSPAGSQRIIWWFSGRSRRLFESEREGEIRERVGDVRIELGEKGRLGLGLCFGRLMIRI